jgi:hypothetical protein
LSSSTLLAANQFKYQGGEFAPHLFRVETNPPPVNEQWVGRFVAVQWECTAPRTGLTSLEWFRGEVIMCLSQPILGVDQLNVLVRYARWNANKGQDVYHHFSNGNHHLTYDSANPQGARWLMLR